MKKREAAQQEKKQEFYPRFEYSPEEIQKMLADIDGVVSARKAEEQGIDPEDMIKTVRGGKVVWITRDEMNRLLAKKKRLSGKKFVQRSVRGEDSLSSEINARARACKTLVDAIRKAAPEEVPDLIRKLRELDSVLNQSLSLGKEVQMLELAIERKKSEDPVLQDIDRATSEMLAAIDRKDFDEAEVCKTYSDKHAEEYMARQKRLEPYIKKAKECRTQYLTEKCKIFQLEFEIIARGEEILTERMQDLVYHDKEGTTIQGIISMAEEIRSIVTEARPSFEGLSNFYTDEIEEHSSLFQDLDKKYLTPLFAKTIEFIEAFRDAWARFVEGKETAGNKTTVGKKTKVLMDARRDKEEDPKRMAYQEQTEPEE